MVRVLLLLCVVFSASAEARQRKVRREHRQRIADEGVRLRVLPMGGGQSTKRFDLRDHFETDFTGAWFYLRGDGTVPTGSAALTAIGAPTTQTDTICPSGPNCESISSRRLNGTSQSYRTANVSSPSGDASTCIGFRYDTNNNILIAKDSNEAGNRSWEMGVNSSDALYLAVYKSDGTSTLVAGATLIPGGLYFACATYDFVADGSSVIKTYVNGIEHGTTSTSAVGPMQAPGSSTYWAIGQREYSGFEGWLKGNVFFAFMTEKTLSAGTIASMNRVAMGALTGSYGEAITITRASASSCANSDGTVLTKISDGRPCVRKGGIEIWQASTNSLLRSEEFDNAAWTKGQGAGQQPTITANTNEVLAPDGTQTAEKFVFSALTGTQGSQVFQSVTVTAAPWTRSVWVRGSATTPTGTIWMQATPDAVTWQTTACPFVQGSWTRCVGTTTPAAGGSFMHIGQDCRDPALTCPLAAKTVYVWGAQWELGSFASPYIRTVGSTVTRAADQATVANPLNATDLGTWCYAATFMGSGWPSAGGNGVLFMGSAFAAANSAAIYLGGAGSARTSFVVYDGSGVSRFITGPVGAPSNPGPHRIRACNSNGNLSMTLDGISQGAHTGLGNGLMTAMPATVRIGDLTTGIAPFNGTLSDVCIGKPEACQ